MGKALLKSARKHRKNRNWHEAIKFYKQYFDTYETRSDKAYVAYARCLRVTGHTILAEKLLLEGKAQHPNSERILIGLYQVYDVVGNWKEAKVIAETLIKRYPNEGKHYFRMGRTYAFLSNYEQAGEIYKTGLEYQHGLTIDKLIEKIQLGFTDTPEEVTSEYIFINGRNNLGAFIHEYKGEKYFTKISATKRSTRRETIFNEEIVTKFPRLQSAVPAFIDTQKIDGIIYLTTEMIEDIPTTTEHIKNIISTSQNISSIPYNDLIKEYSNPNYLFQLKSRCVSIIIFFTKIHDKSYNERLFTALHKLVDQKKYSLETKEAILKLESLIMDNFLYKYINPEDHYSLVHGDFIPNNVKIKQGTESPQVFDWATFNLGPHFIDIARYLAANFTPYSEIKEIYLSNDETGGKLSLIEKIFFLYALVLFYLFTVGRVSRNTRVTEFISPALTDMEQYVNTFNAETYDSEFLVMLQERNEYKHKVNYLEKKITHLEKKRAELTKKNKDILQSKSWKLTAPLRKVMELFTRK